MKTLIDKYSIKLNTIEISRDMKYGNRNMIYYHILHIESLYTLLPYVKRLSSGCY